MVVGDLTLESLIPNVNARLEDILNLGNIKIGLGDPHGVWSMSIYEAR
jgi:hypothetical protein